MNDSSPPDLDTLMERIRAELRKTDSRAAPATNLSPATTPVSSLIDASKRQYRFSEFTSLDNDGFVRNAYLAVLGREPDEIGRLTTLHRLESGQIGRASLLIELLNSEEGRKRGVSISGFGLQPRLERIRYNRLTRMVPTAARLLRNAPRIANHVRQLAAQAATAERLALQAVASADAAQRMVQSHAKARSSDTLASLEARLREQRGSMERQIEALRRDVEAKLESIAARDDFEHRTAELQTRISEAASLASAGQMASQQAIEQVATDLSRVQAELQRRLGEQWRSLVDQKLRLDVLLKEARRRMPEPLDSKQIANIAGEEQHLLDAFYVAFEDRYRGTRADIKDRQKVYLPDIERAAAAAGGGSLIVDLGCGRGEWLELLQESGFTAKGYDLNRMMVQESQERGLDATLSDALQALASMPDNSLTAVTGLHVIEHLPFDELIQLFDQALRVLRPGGLVIFETPNPGNLLVASERFYMDPTHRNPLPAELIAFVAEARGFTAVESRFLHPPADRITQHVEEPVVELLRERIYAPQDYAILGWKA